MAIPLPFLIARTPRHKVPLPHPSMPQAALLTAPSGKSVALAGTDQGAASDSLSAWRA